MLVPGLGYALVELADFVPPPGHSTGFRCLDERGLIQPGSVWTLATSAAVGATTFAVQVALAACRTGKVLLVNGHMSSHLLLQRVEDALVRDDQINHKVARARIELCSQLGFPPQGDRLGRRWVASGYDLIIVDTMDESFLPEAAPATSEQWLRELRWWRDLARGNNTALLLTARVPSPQDAGSESFRREWAKHLARPVFEDISDVRMEMYETTDTPLAVTAYRRGLGWWFGRGGLARSAGSELRLRTASGDE